MYSLDRAARCSWILSQLRRCSMKGLSGFSIRMRRSFRSNREAVTPPWLVEGYPALVARRWIGRSGKYKNDDRKKWTPEMRDNRRTLVEKIQRSGPPWAYDCRVCLDPATARDCVEDGSGDQLDAVFCAMQAAWAFKRGSGGYGVPASCDLLEGWIVDPFARMRFGRASSVGSGSRS